MNTFVAKKNSSTSYERLTMLPDLKKLKTHVEQWKLKNAGLSLICYDIALLRRINYVYGRETGDALLAAVGDWVSNLPGTILYRIEGDMFCLVLPEDRPEEALRFAHAIEDRFNEPWILSMPGGPIEVFICSAISVIPYNKAFWGYNLPDLIQRSVDAARKANQIIVFDAETADKAKKLAVMQMDLKNCVLRNMTGFEVYFQPITDVISGTWRGLEALCRWTSPTLGPVPPNVFIPEAEESGLIHCLGEWVLERAVETCKNLRLDEMDHFFVSVNVSSLQIGKSGFAGKVLAICRRHGFPCGKLLLEITESTQFTFNENTMATITRLRGAGVLFALDDFGTGYSGFNNLKNLPVNFLKTEKEFIEGIEEDNSLQYFYYVMSETAHANGKCLIAEGIEVKEQLQIVIKNGVDLVQGYLFGRPMGTADLERQIDQFRRPHEAMKECQPGITDFGQWVTSRDAYEITPALFGVLSKCMHLFLDGDDHETAFNRVLAIIGEHFKVNRVYVFLRDDGTIFSNKYEWCAQGQKSQLELFQHMDVSKDGFYEILMKNKIVIASTESALPEQLRGRLHSMDQGASIQSIIALPMKRQGEIIGFVGFDDDCMRKWSPEEMILLHALSMLVVIVLTKSSVRAERLLCGVG